MQGSIRKKHIDISPLNSIFFEFSSHIVHPFFLWFSGQRKQFSRSNSVGNQVLRGPKSSSEDEKTMAGSSSSNQGGGRKRNSSSEQNQTSIGGDFLSNPSAALQR